jgi:hypothetical protein
MKNPYLLDTPAVISFSGGPSFPGRLRHLQMQYSGA